MCYRSYVVGYSTSYIDGVAPAESINISFYDYAKRLINEFFLMQLKTKSKVKNTVFLPFFFTAR